MTKNLVFDVLLTIVSVLWCVCGFVWGVSPCYVVAASFLFVGFPATWIENILKNRGIIN